MTEATEHRAGTVAVVGRPNVGKSTLLNALVGQRISITSRKPQTTRSCVTGIVTAESAQIALIDTPGFQLAYDSRLNRVMNRAVARRLSEADAVLWVVEALRFDERDASLQRLLPREKAVVIAVNKIDTLREKQMLLPFLDDLSRRLTTAAIVPVSAARGTAVATLVAVLTPLLPVAARMFEEDEFTTLSERELAAELIREQLFRQYGEELPYACAVEVESFKAQKGLRVISAGILVDKDSQKAILIGRRGEKMKMVASRARRGMETIFGGKVHLDIWVKTRGGWADDERILRRLGLEVDR